MKATVLSQRDVALEERLIDRTDGAEEVAARAQHVERHAPLVEVDEEAAEEVVDRVDVVEQAEDVGLAPGQVLPTEANEDRPLLPVDEDLEEAVAVARDLAQAVPIAVVA